MLGGRGTYIANSVRLALPLLEIYIVCVFPNRFCETEIRGVNYMYAGFTHIFTYYYYYYY